MEELRTMSTKELDRVAVMARLVAGTLSQRSAAEVLRMTVRQNLARPSVGPGESAAASSRRAGRC